MIFKWLPHLLLVMLLFLSFSDQARGIQLYEVNCRHLVIRNPVVVRRSISQNDKSRAEQVTSMWLIKMAFSPYVLNMRIAVFAFLREILSPLDVPESGLVSQSATLLQINQSAMVFKWSTVFGSFLIWNCNSSYKCYLTGHIVFQDIIRIKNVLTRTQTGCRDTVTGVYSDNSYTFSLRTKLSYAKHSSQNLWIDN